MTSTSDLEFFIIVALIVERELMSIKILLCDFDYKPMSLVKN